MAGDWIKMRIDLQTHPKVVRILSALQSDKFRVIGGLHAVWSVFDTHSTDGRLIGYTPDALDHVIGWPGFAAAMISVQWLVSTTDGCLALPEFAEHNGQSAKRRAEDQKRKRNSRSVHNTSDASADKVRTQSGPEREKRRVSTSRRSVDDAVDRLTSLGVDPKHANDWMQVRKDKGAKGLTETALEEVQRQAQKAGISLARAVQISASQDWRGFKADWYARLQQATPAHGARPANRFTAAAAAVFQEPGDPRADAMTQRTCDA
jgi:hypothetical protein